MMGTNQLMTLCAIGFVDRRLHHLARPAPRAGVDVSAVHCEGKRR